MNGLAIHLPQINPNESTFQAFKRLTEQQPSWVPFAKAEAAKNNVKQEEFAYFNQEMEDKKYSQHAAYLNARNCFGTFASNWDLEVASCYKSKASGNEGVILIHRKTVLQLQEHYDCLQNHLEEARMVRPNDEA
jgi:hypothetical protein